MRYYGFEILETVEHVSGTMFWTRSKCLPDVIEISEVCFCRIVHLVWCVQCSDQSKEVSTPIFQNCPSRTERGRDAKRFDGVTVETDQLCSIILLNGCLVLLYWLRQSVT